MKPKNINAENLELPLGHRWVDIANEPFTTQAKFYCNGDWSNEYTDPENGEWYPTWSYCIPVKGLAHRPTPEEKAFVDCLWSRLRRHEGWTQNVEENFRGIVFRTLRDQPPR